MTQSKDTFTFNGFEPANTTPVPDVLFDELLSWLSGSELKVLLYIIRRTRGFKKDSDAISLSQFQHGIITKDGRQLDKGCGIDDRQTIINALTSLEKKRCIVSEKCKTAKGDNATTVYRILFNQGVVGKANQGSREKSTTLVGNSNHRSGKKPTTVVGKSNPQETVLQQTDTQETDLQERESNNDDTPKPPVVSSDTAPAFSLQDEKMFTDEKPQGDDHANCVPALPAANPAASSQPTPPRHTEDNSDGASLPANGLPVVRPVGDSARGQETNRVSGMVGRDTIHTLEQKGQTDGLTHDHTGDTDHLSNDHLRNQNTQGQGRLAETPSTPMPAQSLSLPQAEQAALGQSPKGKSKKQAEPKPETPKGPPVEPPSDMAWGTRKCLLWFDYWRGGILIGKFKLMQASTCAKGLAEQFDEQTVIQARTDMEADPYYAAKGGCDVCDVANNIHKYLKKRQSKVIAFRGKQPIPQEDLVEWQGRMMTVTEADTLGFNGGFGAYL